MNLPTVNMDKLSNVLRVAPIDQGDGALVEFVLENLGIEDARTYALMPVNEVEIEPVWWCEVHDAQAHPFGIFDDPWSCWRSEFLEALDGADCLVGERWLVSAKEEE